MSFKSGIIQFIHGFKDSFQGCIRFLFKQKAKEAQGKNEHYKKLRHRLIESCILNGLFLLACILFFNYLLMPMLNWIVFKFLREDSYNFISSYLNSFMHLLFSFVWLMPVFLLSKIFNVLCYQDIADMAYMTKYGKPKLYKNSPISYVIADSIFSCVLQVIFLIQSSIMLYLPIYMLNQILFHVHISFLYSLYAFEYKWFNMGWNILDRLNYIETRWPYYFGFGLSLSILTSLPSSYILSATLFAFLFPAFILSAIEADCAELTYNPKKIQTENKNLFTSLHLFHVSTYLTDHLFKFLKYYKTRADKRKQQLTN